MRRSLQHRTSSCAVQRHATSKRKHVLRGNMFVLAHQYDKATDVGSRLKTTAANKRKEEQL